MHARLAHALDSCTELQAQGLGPDTIQGAARRQTSWTTRSSRRAWPRGGCRRWRRSWTRCARSWRAAAHRLLRPRCAGVRDPRVRGLFARMWRVALDALHAELARSSAQAAAAVVRRGLGLTNRHLVPLLLPLRTMRRPGLSTHQRCVRHARYVVDGGDGNPHHGCLHAVHARLA